jgi:pSer/pThr/pTyr-binding forkhead associated (FHA) protein
VQIFPLDESVINLGRRSDNHVVIDEMRVSRKHAQIRAIKGHYVIFDLDSSGGTYVNGVLSSQATLYPGDVISLAGVDLVYGQDAAYLSGNDSGSTQPLVPFPGADD